MSLNLDGPQGYQTSSADVTAFPTDADFSEDLTKSARLLATVDASAGAIALTPAPITGVKDGTELTLVINETSNNGMTVTDPNTTIALDYATQQGESYSFIWDEDNGQWNVKF